MAHFVLAERHFRDLAESKLPLQTDNYFSFFMLFHNDLQIFENRKSSEA